MNDNFLLIACTVYNLVFSFLVTCTDSFHRCYPCFSLCMLVSSCIKHMPHLITVKVITIKPRATFLSVWAYYINNKIFREFWENNRFLKIFLSIYLETSYIHLNFYKMLLPSYRLMVANEGSIACKCFK